MTETYIKNTTKDLAPSIRGELTYEDKVIEKLSVWLLKTLMVY